MKAKMIKVESSNVVAIGYKDNKLYVDFKTGSYVYYDVPQPVYDEFVKAESKGKYVWSHLRGNYAYERLKDNN